MSTLVGPDEIGQLAPSGYYVALRIGFAFPMEEVNAFPAEWINHYTKQRFMLFDPVVRWAYSNVGTVRWSEIPIDDPKRIIAQAQTFECATGRRFLSLTAARMHSVRLRLSHGQIVNSPPSRQSFCMPI